MNEFEEDCSALATMFEAIPESWTKDAIARDSHGNHVHHDDIRACCWCQMGARRAFFRINDSLAIIAISQKMGFSSPIGLNDMGGRIEVIKMLRIASGEIK